MSSTRPAGEKMAEAVDGNPEDGDFCLLMDYTHGFMVSQVGDGCSVLPQVLHSVLPGCWVFSTPGVMLSLPRVGFCSLSPPQGAGF